ncbi:LysE family translocator [Kribbella deserti]|uniref:LysE family translocator n=1 Tax=Kribbella deserti TaxID=1926257 RepID=A0ABV6QIA5_9ACTN
MGEQFAGELLGQRVAVVRGVERDARDAVGHVQMHEFGHTGHPALPPSPFAVTHLSLRHPFPRLLAATAGLATLFALVPEIYVTLKIAGAAYLLWLAWNALRPRGDSAFTPNAVEPDRPRKLFGMGLLTCLLNPKIAVLYISLLPQFVDPSRGHVGAQSLILGLTQLTVGVAVNAVFVITASSVAIFFNGKPLWAKIHRYLTGTALAVFAIKLATDRTHPPQRRKPHEPPRHCGHKGPMNADTPRQKGPMTRRGGAGPAPGRWGRAGDGLAVGGVEFYFG